MVDRFLLYKITTGMQCQKLEVTSLGDLLHDPLVHSVGVDIVAGSGEITDLC